MVRFHFKPIHIVILIVSGAVLIGSLGYLIAHLVEEKQSQKRYQEIESAVESILGKDTETGKPVWNRGDESSTGFWDNPPVVETATKAPETQTETETEKVTEKVTEKETEKVTETEKEVETEKETEKVTENEKGTETEEPTEKPTEQPTETPTETSTETESETESIEYSEKFLAMKQYIEELQTVNSEVYGYLYCEIMYPNTTEPEIISYPLMLTSNNSYYLTHTWDNKYSKTGALFADYRTFADYERNRNIVIYGHNMAVGSMLHKLTKLYQSKSAFFGHKGQDPAYVDIKIYTTEAIYNYEVFAIYATEEDSDYRTVYFNSSNAWLNYLNKCQDNSKWKKNFEFYPSDRIITFSTCTTLEGKARLAVQAILTSIEH